MNHFITKLNEDLSSQLQGIDLEEPDLIRKGISQKSWGQHKEYSGRKASNKVDMP